MKIAFKYILTLIICLFVSNVQAKRKTDLEKFEIKGNIKEMRIHHTGEKPYEKIYRFDENGNTIEKIMLKEGKTIQTSKEEYKYDSLKNIIKHSRHINGEYKYSNEYIYNEKGLMIESLGVDGRGKTKFKYDDSGKCIEKSCYSKNNQLLWTKTNKYNNKGDITEEIEYNTNEKFKSSNGFHHKTVFIYNDNGNLVEETKYLPNGDFEYKNTNKYDNNGNCIEETHYEPKNRYSGKEHYEKKEYKFDLKGNCIEIKTYDAIDNLKKTVEITYDDETGNVTEELHYYGNSPNAYKCVYEYDYYK